MSKKDANRPSPVKHENAFEEPTPPPLKGSVVLLRVAWMLLAIWIVGLTVLALHILGAW
jgi:hypothetical protein